MTIRTRALAVLREPVFSPGMVERDAAILREVATLLATEHGLPCDVVTVDQAEQVTERHVPRLVLNMAEGDDSLGLLDGLSARGALVVNSPSAVRATRRAALVALAAPHGPLVASVVVSTDADPRELPAHVLAAGSVWVKRGDYHALGQGDVVRVGSSEVGATLRGLAARGIASAVLQPHVSGAVLKFYGVAGERPFFRTFVTNDAPAPTPDAIDALREQALFAAARAGLEVFGGDAVLGAAGQLAIVDLNAWPSFWRCLPDAARAIAGRAAALATTPPVRARAS